MAATEPREPIYCDCHGDVVMGHRVDGKVVWYRDNHHGERHFKSLPEKLITDPSQGRLVAPPLTSLQKGSIDIPTE